jgi:hypothetical protein
MDANNVVQADYVYGPNYIDEPIVMDRAVPVPASQPTSQPGEPTPPAYATPLAAGDFYADPLPTGADLAWVSAIVHQNSRAQNRDLFAKVYAALTPGGRVLIRDHVMDDSHARPPAGAMFAVNMLVGTPHGGTFSLAELRADLEAAGFTKVTVVCDDPGMNAVVEAWR